MNDAHDNAADDRAMLERLTSEGRLAKTVTLDILADRDTDPAVLAEVLAEWPDVISVRHNGELLA